MKQTSDYLVNIISLSYSIILFSRKNRDKQETIYQRVKIQFQLGNHRIPILKRIRITGLLKIIRTRKKQLDILQLIFDQEPIQQDPYVRVNPQISFVFLSPLRISDNCFQNQILKESLANHNPCIRLYSNQYLELSRHAYLQYLNFYYHIVDMLLSSSRHSRTNPFADINFFGRLSGALSKWVSHVEVNGPGGIRTRDLQLRRLPPNPG